MRGSGELRVGCSGWEYKHWSGDFYPADLPRARWLEHYARTFDTVEVNNSFYRLPDPGAVSAWAARVPSGFLFAMKASRYLTHMRKLKDPADPLQRIFERAERLGPKRGPILYQLPPRWARNVERLEAFLDAVPRGIPQAIEFRDPSWYHEDVYRLLERAGVALCLHDMAGSTTDRRPVGPFVYVRFHGGEATYRGSYPDDVLTDWARWLGGELAAGRAAYAYFNNDALGHAPRNALTLRRLLTARVAKSRVA